MGTKTVTEELPTAQSGAAPTMYAELNLLPQHIRLLADSGISPEVAKVSEFSRIARRPEQTTYLDIQRGRIPAINLGRRGLRIDLGEALGAFPRVGGRPE